MLTLDASEAIAALSLIASRASDMSPLMEEFGELQVIAVRERLMNSKTTPWGADWAPWRPMTEIERTKKGNADQGLLWDTGTLLNSIRFEASPLGVEIGTDVDYAVDLQNGTLSMADRDFLGWSPDFYPTAERLALIYLETGL